MFNKYITFYLILFLCISQITLIFIFNTFVLTKNIFYDSLSTQMTFERINELIDKRETFAWIGYLFIPLIIVLKVLIGSMCIQIGLILQNIKFRFKTVLTITVTANFIFILPLLIKLVWFLLIKTDYTLTDVQQFYPLSALNLFKVENLSPLLIYPFQTFNVFEILYWLLLAGGIKQALDIDINKSIKVVFTGYIPALALWMLCVMFVTVSLSPAT